jgi:hypothetical protein
VTFTNGSRLPIDLNAVVVSAAYGEPAVAAQPVYSDPSLSDFSGVLPPGKTTTAAYAFSVPADRPLVTTVWVDFDGQHTPATFSGSLPG